uniref:Replication protein n=1 Tax=Panagrolaimus sp. PS1159 TaxID=55785 RepID=A0AC35GA02_9BILA
EEYKNLLYATHCIAQGRTKRWIFVWTFNPTVKINTRLSEKSLFFRKYTEDLISFFCQICKWANIEISKHSSGYLICIIPSSKMLTFKPWTNKKRKNNSDEGLKKFIKIDSSNAEARLEVDANLNDVAADEPLAADTKTIRLVIQKKDNSVTELNVEFYTGDVAGFKWMESLINYAQDNPYLLKNGQ